ncbi:hypothetical protein EG329_000163 [Mollisiaceae sp. DMI_Dod_QoI]|nr:hypothetical protein EG329_000163 [Helotiales sp. DMI_Dod_QoI]
MPNLTSKQTLQTYTTLERIRHEQGYIISSLILLLFSSVVQTMDRVERVVLSDSSYALSFKTLLMSDYTMLSIAGTIMAQLAITALTLQDLSQVHWTATSGFITSLVFGCLSVWTSTKISRLLTSLDTSDTLRDWLSAPASKAARKEFDARLKELTGSDSPGCNDDCDILNALIADFLQQNRWKTASFYACTMLSAPAMLLNYSLISFFTALGIYVSASCQNTSSATAVNMTSPAIMICYFVALVIGFALFSVSAIMKITKHRCLENGVKPQGRKRL